jgi:hypothetical protein
MGEATITRCRDEKCAQNFSFGKLEGRDHMGDLGIDGKRTSKWIVTLQIHQMDVIHELIFTCFCLISLHNMLSVAVRCMFSAPRRE